MYVVYTFIRLCFVCLHIILICYYEWSIYYAPNILYSNTSVNVRYMLLKCEFCINYSRYINWSYQYPIMRLSDVFSTIYHVIMSISEIMIHLNNLKFGIIN